VHQSWRREQAGRIFNLLVRLVTGFRFGYAMRLLKRFASRRADDSEAAGSKLAFDVEVLYLAHRAGLRLREVPVPVEPCRRQ